MFFPFYVWFGSHCNSIFIGFLRCVDLSSDVQFEIENSNGKIEQICECVANDREQSTQKHIEESNKFGALT